MRILQIIILCFSIAWIASCSKNDTKAPLAEGSVSIQYIAEKDTLEMPLSILKDSAIVLGLKAVLSGSGNGADHWITFAVDTTKITEYRSRFGNAMLLPTTSYLFYKSQARIAAGSTVSDSAQINIGFQTKLKEYSTYVLPVKILSVDGQQEGAATNRVVYFVFKTGKPLFVSKEGWTIAGNSSVNGTSVPANILDADNANTFWASNITQFMPQWIAINFNKEVTFTSLSYYIPTALGYPNNGGYPTSVQIETSMDNTNWTSKGIFAGNIAKNMQTIDIGVTTARYLRFTSLASVKYFNQYEAIFIAGISLVP